MKRFISLVLALILCLGMLTIVAFAQDSSPKLTDTLVTYVFARGENPAQPILADSPSYQEAAKLTGVKIDMMVIPSTDYTTKMTAMLASNTLPDIFVPFGDMRELVDAGMLLPLKDLIAQYAPNIQKILDTTPNLNRTTIEGEYYTLPRLRMDSNYEKGCVGFIRVDLLNKNGLPMPKTWQEWYETMKVLQELYPEMLGYSARGFNRLIGVDKLSPVRSLGGEYGMYLNDQGEWKLGRMEDEYKEVIAFLKKLYDEKILDNEYLTVNLQTLQENCSSGKALFWYDNPTFASGINEALKTVDPEARFEPVPILENWKGEKVNYVHPDHYFNQFAFSSKVKNPELLIQFMDWAYSEQGALVFNYGIEGETYELIDGEPQWTQATIKKYQAMDNSFYKLQSDYGLGDVVFAPAWLYTIYDQFKTTGTAGAVDSLYIHNMYKDEPGLLQQPVSPPFTLEESTRVTEINQEIQDYSVTTINQMIMGNVSLDTYSDFVNTLVNKGADELESIYNAAEARLKAQ